MVACWTFSLGAFFFDSLSVVLSASVLESSVDSVSEGLLAFVLVVVVVLASDFPAAGMLAAPVSVTLTAQTGDIADVISSAVTSIVKSRRYKFFCFFFLSKIQSS